MLQFIGRQELTEMKRSVIEVTLGFAEILLYVRNSMNRLLVTYEVL